MFVATAPMAFAQRVITLDDKSHKPTCFLSYAALGLVFGVTHRLISGKSGSGSGGRDRMLKRTGQRVCASACSALDLCHSCMFLKITPSFMMIKKCCW